MNDNPMVSRVGVKLSRGGVEKRGGGYFNAKIAKGAKNAKFW